MIIRTATSKRLPSLPLAYPAQPKTIAPRTLGRSSENRLTAELRQVVAKTIGQSPIWWWEGSAYVSELSRPGKQPDQELLSHLIEDPAGNLPSTLNAIGYQLRVRIETDEGVERSTQSIQFKKGTPWNKLNITIARPEISRGLELEYDLAYVVACQISAGLSGRFGVELPSYMGSLSSHVFINKFPVADLSTIDSLHGVSQISLTTVSPKTRDHFLCVASEVCTLVDKFFRRFKEEASTLFWMSGRSLLYCLLQDAAVIVGSELGESCREALEETDEGIDEETLSQLSQRINTLGQRVDSARAKIAKIRTAQKVLKCAGEVDLQGFLNHRIPPNIEFKTT